MTIPNKTRQERWLPEKGLTKALREKSLNWMVHHIVQGQYIENEPEMSMPWQNFPGNRTRELSPKCNEVNQRLSKVK